VFPIQLHKWETERAWIDVDVRFLIRQRRNRQSANQSVKMSRVIAAAWFEVFRARESTGLQVVEISHVVSAIVTRWRRRERHSIGGIGRQAQSERVCRQPIIAFTSGPGQELL